MQFTMRTAAVVLALAEIAGSPAAARDPDPRAIQAHMEFLADDLLQGREPGSPGYDVAALYVASQFRSIGLEPAGRDGTFFQPVPLRRSRLAPKGVTLGIEDGSGETFSMVGHVVAYPSAVRAVEELRGRAVFAGNGIVEARLGRDDYAGLDVRGKLVFVLGGPAAGIPAEVAAHLSRPGTQAARAAERGALGLIVINTPAAERRLSFNRLREITQLPRMTWVDAAVSPLPGGAPAATAFVDETAAAALFKRAPRSYAAALKEAATGGARGFDLGISVSFHRSSALDDVRSANVAALLPGSDPTLAREVVVVTTHLDHVGIGPAVDGDSIYNGAIDNASGVAATLEMARALAGDRPRRSVLFLAVTAEEKGLVGSDYFARAPTVPSERLVGAINLDGVMAFYDFRSVVGYGVESSTLRTPLEHAVRSMGLTLMPDPNPATSIFTQSDHYSMVRQGIPAVFLQIGEGLAPGGGSGLALSAAWDKAHLHKPSDDLKVAIDYAVFSRFTELYRRFVLEAANMPEAPRWIRGDFFGETFAPHAPKASPQVK